MTLGRSGLLDPGLEVAVEGEDRAGQVAAAADELACDPYLHRLLTATQPAGDPVEPPRLPAGKTTVGIKRGPLDIVLGVDAVVTWSRFPIYLHKAEDRFAARAEQAFPGELDDF